MRNGFEMRDYEALQANKRKPEPPDQRVPGNGDGAFAGSRLLTPAREYVGWQFRYVFEEQGNRRSDWCTVLEGEPTFTSGYRSYNGWQRHYFYEVRRVYAAAVEPYVEDPHHKP